MRKERLRRDLLSDPQCSTHSQELLRACALGEDADAWADLQNGSIMYLDVARMRRSQD